MRLEIMKAVRRWPKGLSWLPACQIETFSAFQVSTGPTVIARVLDPYRAEWYERQGVHTICPTRVAIEMLEGEVREAAQRAAGGARPSGPADHEHDEV